MLFRSLTGTLNLGGEIRCDDTHSFNLRVNYNPWNLGENKKMKHILIQRCVYETAAYCWHNNKYYPSMPPVCRPRNAVFLSVVTVARTRPGKKMCIRDRGQLFPPLRVLIMDTHHRLVLCLPLMGGTQRPVCPGQTDIQRDVYKRQPFILILPSIKPNATIRNIMGNNVHKKSSEKITSNMRFISLFSIFPKGSLRMLRDVYKRQESHPSLLCIV